MTERNLRKLAAKDERISRTTQKLYNLFLIISGIGFLVSFFATRRLLQLEQEDYADEELHS